ncbi:MAG: hypothetical protein KJS91_15280, partial [Planctomycetes bacterium]|nr:hypothetical protein [Planctomycetota bacterium]
SPSGRTAVEELVLGEEQAEEAPELLPPQFLPADWMAAETASMPPGGPVSPPVATVPPLPAPPAAPAWEMWVLGALVAVCLFLVVAIGLLLAGVF